MFDFLQGLKVNITVAGAAAVLALLIVCITVLTLNDKQIPSMFYILVGVLGTAIVIIGRRSSDH